MSLLGICGVAFVLVLGMLSLLAVLIYLIGKIFPEIESETDVAMIAGIHNAVSTTLPGARVVQIVEINK